MPNQSWYSGKLLDKIKINVGKYVEIAGVKWKSAWNGHGRLYLYSKYTYTLKPGYLTEVIRIRGVRETDPEDTTGFRDITVSRKNCPVFILGKSGWIPNPELLRESTVTDWLIWADWFGEIVKDRSMRWEISAGPGIATLQQETRYSKAFWDEAE